MTKTFKTIPFGPAHTKGYGFKWPVPGSRPAGTDRKEAQGKRRTGSDPSLLTEGLEQATFKVVLVTMMVLILAILVIKRVCVFAL